MDKSSAFWNQEDFLDSVPLVIESEYGTRYELLGALFDLTVSAEDAGPKWTVLGEESPAVTATRRVIEAARDDKVPAPAVYVLSDAADGSISAPIDPMILGAEVEEILPLTAKLWRQHRRDPQRVRCDTLGTYRGFRAEKSTEMEELRQKVADLDALLHAHMLDPDAHRRAVMGAMAETKEDVRARRVPLSLPPWMDGKVDCWRDDDVVCCSIALPGSDGEVRICTSATPIARHVEDVVGYTHQVGADMATLMGVLPTVACMMAGGSLLPTMAAAAPQILAQPEVDRGAVFMGAIVPAVNPSMVTLMDLLQRCQSGDPQACAEWRMLAEVGAQDERTANAMTEARARLVAAQAAKGGA